jgi:hypothetical protein
MPRFIPVDVVRNLKDHLIRILEMKNIIVLLAFVLFAACHNQSGNIKKQRLVQSQIDNIQKEQNIDLSEIKDTFHLSQIQLLGEMGENGKSITIVFGEVDAPTYMEKSLYLYPQGTISFADSLLISKFSLPGNEYDVTDSLVYHARVFYGNCSKDFPFSIIWVQETKQNDQNWTKSIYVLTPDNSNKLEYSFKEDSIIIKEIEENLKLGNCKEIPGMDIYLEP